MSADEMEHYLAIQYPQVQRAIAESNADIKAGRTRPAEALLAESKKEDTRKRPAKRRRKA